MRVTPEEKSEGRINMFHMQQKVAALDVPMCRPVEFGKCDEGTYIVQTWIDGRDASYYQYDNLHVEKIVVYF